MAQRDPAGARPPSFALIGAAGYIAPRHFRAIKEVGGTLKAAMDPADSVGALDTYFPEADFFVELERLDGHLDKLRRAGEKVDYLSICSPNHLHDAHVRFALRSDMDAICEKPLVLNPGDIDALADFERSTGRSIGTIMQLRLHPAIIALQQKLSVPCNGPIHDVDLTYITSRGPWYHASWKGDESRSGGVAMNIGVHFFDVLSLLFGSVRNTIVHIYEHDRAAGYLEYDRARVRWFLSINRADLPPSVAEGKTMYRSIILDAKKMDFSDYVVDLHTLSYREILKGNRFTLRDVRPAIETIAGIRNAPAQLRRGELHPLAAQVLSKGAVRHG